MTLQFQKSWNVVTGRFKDAPDAAMIPMLNPNEQAIRAILTEAFVDGGWLDPLIRAMFLAAMTDKGEIVSIRAGAHQVEDNQGGGFQLHIGTLFRGENYHLNLQQNIRGKLYVSSVSRGAPLDPAKYYREVRPGPVPA